MGHFCKGCCQAWLRGWQQWREAALVPANLLPTPGGVSVQAPAVDQLQDLLPQHAAARLRHQHCAGRGAWRL